MVSPLLLNRISGRLAGTIHGYAAVGTFLLALAVGAPAEAQTLIPACPAVSGAATARESMTAGSGPSAEDTLSGAARPAVTGPLIVVGFLGGNVKAANMVHKEAQLARDLQARFGSAVHASVFANGDKRAALGEILRLLDRNGDGCLSPVERLSGRIVLYGHSWGASETVALADRLNDLGIPVLLTVQVDSVEKPAEHDGVIPPNVREAVNFYQTEGLLHGRQRIEASDPKKTRILGNFKSTYRDTPVPLDGYPWFARTFMKSHIEIENDPAVWDQVEALIGAEVERPITTTQRLK